MKLAVTRLSVARYRQLHPADQGLQRLEKLMDEYAGGITVNYMTNEPLLLRGLELMKVFHEDLEFLGAEDLHQLQRCWNSNIAR